MIHVKMLIKPCKALYCVGATCFYVRLREWYEGWRGGSFPLIREGQLGNLGPDP